MMKPLSFYYWIAILTFVFEIIFLIFYSYFLYALDSLCYSRLPCSDSVWFAYGIIFLIINELLQLLNLSIIIFKPLTEDTCTPSGDDDKRKMINYAGFFSAFDMIIKPLLLLGYWVALLNELSTQPSNFKLTSAIGIHAPILLKYIIDLIMVSEKMHGGDYDRCLCQCFYIESRTEKEERIEMQEQRKRAAHKQAEAV